MSEIKIDDLKQLCLKALINTGLLTEHAQQTVDHYLENECSGKKSHGMVRVVQISNAIRKIGLPDKEPEIIIDNGNIAVIKGNMNLGPVVANLVVNESIKRAGKHGISFVGMNQYFGNTGSMAYYLRRLADNNYIAFMSCSSECMVAAPSGKDRLLGTNPIGICVPSKDGSHFISDFATSAIAFGKILVALDQEKQLPKGCIIDQQGNPSTNPKDAESDGAILPLADYRGFSLGLFVEMLGMLMGGEVLHNETYGKDGLFIIAIDPSKFKSNYVEDVDSILSQMRNSNPAPGHDKVSIPGDRSADALKKTLERGTIDVADKTLEKIKELAK